MKVDKKELGERIAEARKLRGIQSAAGLCRALVEAMKKSPQLSDGKKNAKTTLTPAAVSNWERGEQIPSWDLMDLLELVLEVDQEELLFGTRRAGQLRKERIYLVRVTDDEARLISAYRETSKEGQRTITKVVKSIAEEQPAPEATIHQLRRKDDKANH